MEKVLVSACLLGAAVRYHGGHARIDEPRLARWVEEGRVVQVCPEVAGGLTTPRAPAELQRDRPSAADARFIVLAGDGRDVSGAFLAGAQDALEQVRRHRIRVAILKDGSPSCGSRTIYDGTFSGRRVAGEGVTAAILRAEGVHVFNEHQIAEAAACVAALDRP